MENTSIQCLNITREMENIFFLPLYTLILQTRNAIDTVEKIAPLENMSVGEQTDTILAR